MNLSQETFSQQGQSIQSQITCCTRCSNYALILDQLHRVKEAIQIKNQRINDLQLFIQKISKMAFIDSAPSQVKTSIQTGQKFNSSSFHDYSKNQNLQNLQILGQNKNNMLYGSTNEISFRKNQFPYEIVNQMAPYKQNLKFKIPSLLAAQKRKWDQQSNSKQGSRVSQNSEQVTQSRIKQLIQANIKKKWMQSKFESIKTQSQLYEEGAVGKIKESENQSYNYLETGRKIQSQQPQKLDQIQKNMLKKQIQRLK